MHKADILPPYCALVEKSGSLNTLEPSGPERPVIGELKKISNKGLLEECDKKDNFEVSGAVITSCLK